MTTNRTVIVVGAGASSECKFPTGLELKTEIARLLDLKFTGFEMASGDALIWEAIRIQVQNEGTRDFNPYLTAGRRIRDAMPQAISIDNFIDCHAGSKHLEICGKLGIARAILQSERNSLLFVDWRGRDRHPIYSTLADTWYTAFMQLLTQNCRSHQISERLSRITFVVFNYDRCVEQFLFHGIRNYYGLDEAAAAEVLQGLRVLHPYGSVGSLPWQRNQNSVEFGGDISAKRLHELAAGIKTFTERTDPASSEIKEVRESLRNATMLLFLGFAYHRQNLDLLRPDAPHQDPTAVRYLGTAAGMSESDSALVKEDLVTLASAKPEHIVLRNDLKCGSFFREYWRSLSLG